MFPKQVQTKMNALNKFKRSFNNDADRKNWISYVKYPRLLTLKNDAKSKFSIYKRSE